MVSQLFLARGNFAFQGHLLMSGDNFYFPNWDRGTTGLWYLEAKDTAKHLAIHRTAPTANNYTAQNAKGAELENLRNRGVQT